MIGTSTYIGLGIMTAFGIILPVAAAIWWIKTRKERITTVIVGAATWLVFALILESIPKAVLFNPAFSIGKAVMDNVALYTVFGVLLAGIFEETGRLVAFKTLLKKRTNRETSVSHGIGHGGIEALVILTVTGIQYIVYAALINSGSFQGIIDQVKAVGADASGLEALPAQIMAITPAMSLIMIVERIFAMILHIGLSMLVFYAVKRSKIRLYVLAILLHAVFDVPAVLYQKGILNMYVVEIMLAAYSVLFFAAVYRLLYKKDGEQTVLPEQNMN